MFHPPSRFAGRAMAVGVLLVASAGRVTPQAPSPIERAGQLLAEAQASFARVRDYTGTLVRQERIAGQLQPEQFIDIRVRQQPYSVCLRWISPRHLAGQEAVFITGKNN